jgi:branched-chain amino acid aminotransferase
MSVRSSSELTTAPFGTLAAPAMVVAETVDGRFGAPRVQPTGPVPLHPFAHALHYGSSCFEGLKAHRGDDGVVRLFRADRHAERLSASARRLRLPDPGPELTLAMIRETVLANLSVVPDPPGALYLRPVLMGTEPNIGAAAAPSADAVLYVVASPVGDYFAAGARALTLLVETEQPRTTPQFGQVKTGANYAMALGVTLEAKAAHGADQVLFAPAGDVQETGAANFLLLDERRLVTRALDGSFLHGVTRDALLVLARELGLEVEERSLAVDELVAAAASSEAALAGTAAVLAGVGTLVVDGVRVQVGDGNVGPTTRRLREALVAIQRGSASDPYGWTSAVG